MEGIEGTTLFFDPHIDWERIRRCSPQVKQDMLSFLEKLKDCWKEYFAKIVSMPFFSPLVWLYEQFSAPEYSFERMAIVLYFNGVDPAECPNILYGCIASSQLSDEKYLEYLLFTEFVLRLLVDGDDTFEARCLSYLGRGFTQNME